LATLATLVCALAGYLIGSVSFAIVVSRIFGLADPRTFGSKNPGATNVLRTGNKAAALITLLADALKGTLAVWLAKILATPYGVDDAGFALTGLAAFIGHLYPLYFRFQGGKGVATFFGVLAIVNIWLALICGATWLLIAYFLRYSSLASIASAVVAVFGQAFGWGFDGVLLCITAMAALLVYRHRQNIVNLRTGKERRIGQKTPGAAKRQSS
jgi:glycerol-3-phosphate acyltransferase PlsY